MVRAAVVVHGVWMPEPVVLAAEIKDWDMSSVIALTVMVITSVVLAAVVTAWVSQ